MIRRVFHSDSQGRDFSGNIIQGHKRYFTVVNAFIAGKIGIPGSQQHTQLRVVEGNPFFHEVLLIASGPHVFTLLYIPLGIDHSVIALVAPHASVSVLGFWTDQAFVLVIVGTVVDTNQLVQLRAVLLVDAQKPGIVGNNGLSLRVERIVGYDDLLLLDDRKLNRLTLDARIVLVSAGRGEELLE